MAVGRRRDRLWAGVLLPLPDPALHVHRGRLCRLVGRGHCADDDHRLGGVRPEAGRGRIRGHRAYHRRGDCSQFVFKVGGALG